MEAKAYLNKLRISPRKVRLIVNLIRNTTIQQALINISYIQKRAVQPIIILINSVVANAANNFKMEANKLFIKKIFVNEGPTLKRFMPRAHGRSFQILKRTSKITIIVSDNM